MKEIFKINPYQFSFAVGKIRALENTLLKEADFQQMLNLDFYQIKEFLSKNRYYKEAVINLNNSQDIEDFLKEKEKELEILIKSLLMQEEIFGLIKELLDFPEDAIKRIRFLKSSFLENYFRHYIDLINLKTSLSLREKKVFFEDGFIPLKTFLNLENAPYGEIIRTFKNTIYASIVEEGLIYYQKENTFLYLETLIRSFLINFISVQKYNPFGIEPIVAYYLARINEFLLLRFILIGKLFKLDKELLDKGIGKTYV